MKIYVLMCYDDNEMNDIPWKYFVDEKFAPEFAKSRMKSEIISEILERFDD